MKTSPLYPFGLAVIALAFSLYLFSTYIFLLGFPDGFVTELGHAEKKLAYDLIRANVAMGVWFAALGIVAFRREIKRKLLYSGILYLVVIVGAFAVDQYFQAYLMGSAGG